MGENKRNRVLPQIAVGVNGGRPFAQAPAFSWGARGCDVVWRGGHMAPLPGRPLPRGMCRQHR